MTPQTRTGDTEARSGRLVAPADDRLSTVVLRLAPGHRARRLAGCRDRRVQHEYLGGDVGDSVDAADERADLAAGDSLDGGTEVAAAVGLEKCAEVSQSLVF